MFIVLSSKIQASQNGHHDTVELLLTKGADPNIQDNDGQTAIYQACLLKHNADPNLPTKKDTSKQ